MHSASFLLSAFQPTQPNRYWRHQALAAVNAPSWSIQLLSKLCQSLALSTVPYGPCHCHSSLDRNLPKKTTVIAAYLKFLIVGASTVRLHSAAGRRHCRHYWTVRQRLLHNDGRKPFMCDTFLLHLTDHHMVTRPLSLATDGNLHRWETADCLCNAVQRTVATTPAVLS